MKTGLKPPSYISAGLMILFGALNLWFSFVLLQDPSLAQKIKSEGASQGRVWIGLIAGILTFTGAIGMIAKKPAGFWAAGLGMLILTGIKVAALTGASVTASKSRIFWARRELLSRASRDPLLRDLVLEAAS